MPVMDAVAYWDPKVDTEPAEWEDGVAYDRVSGWFAVADGASTGAGSREWAQALTSSFVRARPIEVLLAGEDGERGFDSWLEIVRMRFAELESAGAAKVPAWVRDAGRREGAYATMLGGWIDRDIARLVAVGDCCAFVVRDANVEATFPFDDPAGFGNSPDLVASSQGTTARRRRAELLLGPNDELVIATDALAEFLLRRCDDRSVWQLVLSVSPSGFRDLLRDLRVDRTVKNDDVTMLRCRPRGVAHAEGGKR